MEEQVKELIKQNEELIKRVEILEKQVIELQEKRTESYYQRRLQKLLGGHHTKNKHGITDIETDTAIYEIKQFKNYKQVVGQLKAYAKDTPDKKLVAILFGEVSETKRKEIVKFLNEENIYVYEIQDLPNGEIQLIELGMNENHPYCVSNTDNIFNWFDKNIEYNYGSRLSLKSACLSFFGSNQIGVKEKSKFKKQMEICMAKKFTNLNSNCQKTTIDKESFQGWFHIQLKFQNWLDQHIEYKEDSVLQLKDIYLAFFGKANMPSTDSVGKGTFHSKESSKYRKEVSNFLKEKFPQINFVWYENKSVKGWKNIMLI